LFFLSFSVLCLLLANIHILSIVLISYVVGFSVIENREVLFKKKLWASIVVGYSFFIYKILAIQAGGYDSSKMLTAEKIKMTLTNLSEIPSFIFFKEEFVKGYYVLIIACLLMVGLLIYRKKWLDLSYIAFSLIGFFILSIAYNITNDSPVIYQNYYACLGFIIAIPLAKELVSVFQMKIVAALISILLIASLYKIVQCGRMYELRMEYFSRMENNVKGFPESKFMLSTNNINWNMIWMDWNLGFETLLHSAIASPDSAVTFTVENDYSVHDSMMYRPNTFIGVRFSPYWFTSENMPQKYFRIKHTPYRILNKIPNDSLVNSGFNKSNVSIDFDKECDTTLSLFSYQMIPVEITNNSNDTLYSYKTEGKSIALGYKLYDKSGELLKTVPAASNLELDVYPHDSKRSSVNLDYVKRGTYTLEIDLVENETKWLGGSKKKTFTIY
jgi:hypothetical protein